VRISRQFRSIFCTARSTCCCSWRQVVTRKSDGTRELLKISFRLQDKTALTAINEETSKKDLPPILAPFPPYCLRHTALTRLAEAGCDAFTLARIAGHSSITITQRYCHPQADAIERAFSKLASCSKVVTRVVTRKKHRPPNVKRSNRNLLSQFR